METGFPFFYFRKDAILIVNANDAIFCAGEFLQALGIPGRAVPGFFNDDVQSRLDGSQDHERHMRTRRYAEPSNLRCARLGGFRKASHISRFALRWTLSRFFNRYDASAFSGDNRPHPPGPAPTTEDDVAGRFTHARRSFHERAGWFHCAQNLPRKNMNLVQLLQQRPRRSLALLAVI